MTNEYEWIDRRDEFKRNFSSTDVLLGWIISTAVVLFLIV